MSMKDPKLRNSFKKSQGCVIGETANKKCKARIRVVGIPFELTKWIEKKENEISILNHLVATWSKKNQTSTIEEEIKLADNFVDEFLKKVEETNVSNKLVQLLKRYLVCFGPKRCGPNLLINQLIEEKASLFQRFEALKKHFGMESSQPEEPIVTENNKEPEEDKEENIGEENNEAPESPTKKLNYHQRKRVRKMRKLDGVKKWFKINEREIQSAITSGFELATVNGPLFGDRILGACFVIDEIEVIDPAAKQFLIKEKARIETELVKKVEKGPEEDGEKEEDKDEDNNSESEDKNSSKNKDISSGSYSDTYGPITGQIMSLIQKSCRKAFLNAEPRIVEGMYLCELQVISENLGKIYAVIDKHRCKRLSEELSENSELFDLKILVPVYESFSFSDQIRDRECGIPHPQLIFYGWEINDIDPFHVSMTDDEIEEFGDQELPPNQAKIIIDKIRKRKGLPTEKKLVEEGSKQSTLSKKK